MHPLTSTGAEPAALPPGELRHRLPHPQRWLDHLPALGCNGPALGPVSASGTHGHDTVDHLRVDPRLGDDADLDALFAVAGDGRRLMVALDPGDAAVRVPTPGSGTVLAGAATVGRGEVELPAHGWAVLTG